MHLLSYKIPARKKLKSLWEDLTILVLRAEVTFSSGSPVNSGQIFLTLSETHN